MPELYMEVLCAGGCGELMCSCFVLQNNKESQFAFQCVVVCVIQKFKAYSRFRIGNLNNQVMNASYVRHLSFNTLTCLRLFSTTKTPTTITATITQTTVTKFSHISGDTNPLHLNPNYAQQSIFKQRISHGVLPLGFIQQYFTHLNMKIKSIQMRFTKPIYLGEEIQIEIKLMDDSSDNASKKQVIGFVANIRKVQKKSQQQQGKQHQSKQQLNEQQLTLVTSISGQVETVV